VNQPLSFAKGLELLVPAPLRHGDLVGVVSPCGPVKAANLNQGLRFLEENGLRPLVGINAIECQGYLAGTDEQRLRDMNSMLRLPEVRGIIFARGGYGSMRLLDSVDCEAISKDPKLLVGMSDITALQLSLYARCGLVTFSGPMLAGQVSQGLDPLSEKSLKCSLFEPVAGRNLVLDSRAELVVLRHGQARGPLLGGCLSLIAALVGTRHFPDVAGAILFLEDTHEPPYRIDRMLFQLKLAQILDKLAGIILGHFVGPREKDLVDEVECIALELTRKNPIPIISRLPHGHTLPNLTIPHGVEVAIGTDPVSLVVTGG
jgi:muramoyltetrapeptide carboxypeptidase